MENVWHDVDKYQRIGREGEEGCGKRGYKENKIGICRVCALKACSTAS